MLVSFAAATQGGLSLGSEVTTETENAQSRDAKIAGKFSVSNLLSAFIDISLKPELASSTSKQSHAKTIEAKQHTEASIAILLYDFLNKNDGYLVRPTSHAEFSDIGAGTLVEIAGTLHKNAVDSLFDAADAYSIFTKFADSDNDVVEQVLADTRPKAKSCIAGSRRNQGSLKIHSKRLRKPLIKTGNGRQFPMPSCNAQTQKELPQLLPCERIICATLPLVS